MFNRTKQSAAGFTIVELLVVLAITGMLLAALAAALNASIINYRQNEDIFRTINNARQALSRITTQTRTGLVDPNNISDESRCKLRCADNSEITYRYDDADNKLYLITNSDAQEYVLCDNVTSMSFIKTPTDDGLDVKSVQISMTVESRDFQKTISAAAVIRKVIQ